MLVIKNVTLRNFLSSGNVAQTIDLNKNGLSLVIGENLDLGGNGSRNGVGKAQPLTSNILTPSGWKLMGDMSIGDSIISSDGSKSSITGIYPQGKIDTYKITFKDGRTCEASGEHLWSVYSHMFNKISDTHKERIVTTNELITLLNRKHDRPNSGSSSHIYVPLITPENISNIKLPIDPWFLGMMIGDGCFSNNNFSSNDTFIVNKANYIVNRDFNCSIKKSKNTYGYSFKMNKQRKIHPIRIAFHELKLSHTKSYNKFIPEIYKNSSVTQKLELIQGLIDTDGNVSKHSGSVSFTTTSEQLAIDIAYIIRSIGGIASIRPSKNRTYVYQGVRKPCRDSYTVNIRYSNPKNLVSLPRKKDLISDNYQYKNQLRLQIIDISRIDDKESQCIVIDHPSQLYITDNFIVTHNSTILQAISYGLYGQSLTNIKKDNLINKINGKNMSVIIEFEINGHTYKIERGRKPTYFKYIVDNQNISDEATDEAQGESLESQKEIDVILGMSHTMFKHIVALNTYTEPFLSLGATKQREIIEELLGIMILSQKAEKLKDLIKTTKLSIEKEEFRILTVKEGNERIRATMEDISKKADMWDNKHINSITTIDQSIKKLELLNIDDEIQFHRDLEVYNQLVSSRLQLTKDISLKSRHLSQIKTQLASTMSSYETASNYECPTCGQGIHDDQHTKIITDLEASLVKLDSQVNSDQEEIDKHNSELAVINEAIASVPHPTTYYKTLEQALNHRNSLEQLHKDLETELIAENPYSDQNNSIGLTIQEISYDELNQLSKNREHQEFLLKLLTNKDSFIRKKIIDQNLAYLNARLSDYLERLGLPHKVKFINDLTVEISQLGQDLDFYNLSRGEGTRVILALSWAFRDIFENGCHPINLLFIDEILDQGFDQIGIEKSIEILKDMSRSRKKDIFLISHREELIPRVDRILTVYKENNFTKFDWNCDHSNI